MQLIYDIEIKKAIAGKDSERLEGIEYCAGWKDHENMGISSICALEVNKSEVIRPRVFMNDNFDEFREVIDRSDLIVGFNSIPFDNTVCRANGIDVPDEKSYDILRELWLAAGLGEEFIYPSHVGFGLNAVCIANGFPVKSGHGAQAPVQYQQGKIGALIDYNMQDVIRS